MEKFDKEKALEKFLSTHREWKVMHTRWQERRLKNEASINKRLKRIAAILKMRNENKMTMEKIGQKYGITRQRVERILKSRYGKHPKS